MSQKFIVLNRENKEILVRYWPSIKQPRSSVLISHGAAEHIERYEELALFLNQHNLDVYGYDHIGHGINREANHKPIFMAEKDGHNILVSDLEDIATYIVNEKKLPTFILGHSMGSLVSRALMIKSNLNLQGVILSGTMNIPKNLTSVGLLIAHVNKKILGQYHNSRLLNRMSFGRLEQRLSHNKDNIANYKNDIHCGIAFSNSAIIDLLKLTHYVSDFNNLKEMQKTNYLIISGEDDLFSDKTKQLKDLVKEMKRHELKTKAIYYPQMKHEILHEDDKIRVFNNIKEFIEECLNINVK